MGLEVGFRFQLSGLCGKRFFLLSHLISPVVDQASLTLVILLPLFLQHTLLGNTTTANHPLLTHLSPCARCKVSLPTLHLRPLTTRLTRLPAFPSFLFQTPFYVYECSACMCVCVPYAYLVPAEALRGHPFPGTGVIDTCESLCGRWEVNLSRLEGQPVLLPAEPALGPFSLCHSFFLLLATNFSQGPVSSPECLRSSCK